MKIIIKLNIIHTHSFQINLKLIEISRLNQQITRRQTAVIHQTLPTHRIQRVVQLFKFNF